MGVQTCALRISGDSNYNAILASAVNSETFFVDKGTLTLTTTMKNGTTTVTDTSHVALGTVMKDEATLGGTQPFAPTGAVTFTFSGGALGANAARSEERRAGKESRSRRAPHH